MGFLSAAPLALVRAADATDVADVVRHAPEELSTIANVMSAAPPMPFLPPEVHGQPVLQAILAYAGDPEAGQAAVAPFRALASPLVDLVAPRPYADLFPPEEDGPRPHVALQTVFRDTFDPGTADDVVEALTRTTAPVGVVQVRVLGGAMARVPVEATAFAHRHRRLMVDVAAMYEDPEEWPVHRAWVDRYAHALAEGPAGRYVNFLGEHTEGANRAAYPGETWDRLAAIKGRHDPENLFRHNVNVPPAAAVT